MERSLIDLGTQPPGHTLASVEFDSDRIDFVVDSLGVVDTPVVLDVFPRYDDAAERAAGLERGRVGLVDDGLLLDGRLHRDIEVWMRILEQPRWYISARLVTRPYDDTGPILRACVATNPSGSVLAVRDADTLRLRSATDNVARALLDALGGGQGLSFAGISAPTDLLAEALDASPTDVHSTAARLRHIGVEKDAAHDVASAMSTCSAHAEITSVTIEDGNRTADQHPVAFFDTRRGRILATSSTAADGRLWSSLSPGTDAKVAWALSELAHRTGR